jgi:hypothetical protein
MSCLPLFSFSPSIPSVLRPAEGSTVPNPHAQCLATPPITPRVTSASEDLYDKLSQVSVSHRRVDSFEWVMTQSAPNTPSTPDGTSFRPFSPPPQRLTSSAPLPVPGELWSTGPQRKIGKPQRGYFDWWSSPSFSNSTGYAMIPTDEACEEQNASHARRSITGPSTPHVSEEGTDAGPCSRASSTDADRDQLQPSQGLNALGIVLHDTPPPSPSTLKALNTANPYIARQTPSSASSSRLPKRVTFSPIIDEVALSPFSEFKEQRPTHWGSYLPSSFLVARPPLPRTASMPAARTMTATRPILRRAGSSEPRFTRSTEMAKLSSNETERTPVVVPSIPTQRPSVSHSPVVGHANRNTNEADKAFASLLRGTHKPSRRRRDSLLSNASSS